MGFKNWRTDPYWFLVLNVKYQFTIDAAADDSNHLLPRYWTISDDALKQDWSKERVYCNPPYDKIYPWVEKGSKSSNLAFLVLPASVSTEWFHDLIWDDRRSAWREGVAGCFPKGRLKFWLPGEPNPGARHDPLLVCFNGEILI